MLDESLSEHHCNPLGWAVLAQSQTSFALVGPLPFPCADDDMHPFTL
jgi:hypothetical protein